MVYRKNPEHNLYITFYQPVNLEYFEIFSVNCLQKEN